MRRAGPWRVLLEFEIACLPAELEVTWRGERRFAVAGRTLFRGRVRAACTRPELPPYLGLVRG